MNIYSGWLLQMQIDPLSYPNTLLKRMLMDERLIPRLPMHAFSLPAIRSHAPLSTLSFAPPRSLIHRAQQLCLQDEFPLLVLLTRLVGLVVLPPHRVLTLSTRYIPHDMPAGGHIPFRGV